MLIKKLLTKREWIFSDWRRPIDRMLDSSAGWVASDGMTVSRIGGLALCALLLSACAGIVTPPPSFTLYDLDANGDPVRFSSAITPHSVEIKSPSWLNNSAMQYRLDYMQPSSRAVYAESRWVAHPQELIQRTLSAALLGSDNPVSSCRLRLDLDEFIQRFSSPDDSRAELIVRATLMSPRDEVVLKRRQFTVQTPALSADAAGGVVAHREGVRALAEVLSDWLNGEGARQVGGMSAADVCRSPG